MLETLWPKRPEGFFIRKNGGYLHPSVVIVDYSPYRGRKDIQSFL